MNRINRIPRSNQKITTGDRLNEALGALDLHLSQDDLARIETAVPLDAVAGDRYTPDQMRMLDSEKR
ncbi:hypothetical protein [Nostoc commune]|uniref:hypothetical protein n=1 Tax=Nostoc commune TaxID=1178 RepID=UPI001C634AAE|nr:hypothetical protein [Nostoc commune]